MASTAKSKIKTVVLDVDGVLTDGTFWYSVEGKLLKRFGPDDADAIQLLKNFVDVIVVSGDKRGFPITKKRVEDDMKLPLFQVSTFERVKWMQERYNLNEVAYMGDSFLDAMVFDKVGYAVAPANASPMLRAHADFITQTKGGEGAVAEACWHLLEVFFEKPDILNLTIKDGVWADGNK